jgi:methionine synthase II (cobalamin-independent)
MIGSLPYKEPAQALSALAQFPLGIPTWPQLPKRSFKESMTVQYTEGFPGIVVDEKEKSIRVERNDRLLEEMASFYEAVMGSDEKPFAISDAYAAGFHAFVADMAQRGSKLPFIKGQVVGPFTFGFGLSDNDCRAVWFDEQYRDIVVKGLIMKALAQVHSLSAFADKVVIFLDEPIFSALGTPTYIGIENDHVISALNEIATALHDSGALVGVHCCGNMEWSLLANSEIDIISFDAYSFGDKVALYPAEINSFLNRGGRLAWGIVPTDSSEHIGAETGESLVTKIKNLEGLFVSKGVSGDRLMSQRIFTPSCGLGNLSDTEALRVLELLKFVGDNTGN